MIRKVFRMSPYGITKAFNKYSFSQFMFEYEKQKELKRMKKGRDRKEQFCGRCKTR